MNNLYTHNVANWLLGELTIASVTSTLPGQPSQTRSSSFAYNAQGMISQEVIEPGNVALKLVTDYTYDGFGNRITSTISAPGETPRTSSTVYDANGQFPVSSTNALGHSESYLWDARFGVKTSLTGPNGLTTTWAYDGFGRKTGETRADGTRSTTIYHMNVAPFYITHQSSGLPARTVYFDKLGRKIQVQITGFSGNPIYADTQYNALGQVSRQSKPYASGGIPKWTTYSYDAIGRVISFSQPDGSTTTTVYNGLSTSVTNAKAQRRTEIKDVHGRVSQVIDSMNGRLTYAYDPFGNLTATTDAAGHVVSMSYDIRGRKIGMHDPDMGIWTYSYNAFGELISQSNARGQTTSMTYDKLGRILSRTELEGVSNWVYDVGFKSTGKLSSETAPNGYRKIFSYDSFGRPLSTTSLVNNKSFTMSSAYDANGRIDAITYPTGFAVKRIYNAQGYLSQLQNAANAAEIFWQADAVDEEGRVLQETFGNGLKTIHQYNQLTDRLEAIVTGPNADGSIQNLGFSYDALGNLNSRADYVMNWSETFSYDALNRITGVNGPAAKTYAYDAIGNITSKSDVGAYAYDPLHPHAVKSAGGNTYAYDANGNMLSGAGRNLTWTSFDRPATISTPGTYVSMVYDANHRRIMKSTAVGETTIYIGGSFEEVTLNGITKSKHYIRTATGLVAIMEQIATVKLMKYVHNDQLGSINVLTDANGAVLERLSFDASGKPRNSNATDAATPIISTQTTRGYTDHKMDTEVGLINMNARLYDPVLGRFISADVTIDAPQDMQTFNRYTYVINNPFAYTDPTGNWSWKNFWKEARNTIVKVQVLSAAAATMAVGVYTGNPALIAAGYGMMQGYRGYYVHNKNIRNSIIYGSAKGFEAYGYLNIAYGGVEAYAESGAEGLLRYGATEGAKQVAMQQVGGFGNGNSNGDPFLTKAYARLEVLRQYPEFSQIESQLGKVRLAVVSNEPSFLGLDNRTIYLNPDDFNYGYKTLLPFSQEKYWSEAELDNWPEYYRYSIDRVIFHEAFHRTQGIARIKANLTQRYEQPAVDVTNKFMFKHFKEPFRNKYGYSRRRLYE